MQIAKNVRIKTLAQTGRVSSIFGRIWRRWVQCMETNHIPTVVAPVPPCVEGTPTFPPSSPSSPAPHAAGIRGRGSRARRRRR